MRILSKEEAWDAAEVEELWYPIDHGIHDFRIRRRWFHNRNCCTFSTFLSPKFIPTKPWNILTIGVFEGAQEVWLMQNILRHPDSRLVSVDPWMRTEKLDQNFMEECYENAQHNLSPWKDKVELVRGYSQSLLPEALDAGDFLGVKTGEWDLIIIDGDHNADPVFVDAKNSYQLARQGGWLLFDDVRNRVYKHDHVKHGLERFFEQYPDALKFEWAHRYCDCYSKV